MTAIATVSLPNSLPQEAPTVRLRLTNSQRLLINDGFDFLSCRLAECKSGNAAAQHCFRIYPNLRPSNASCNDRIVDRIFVLRLELRIRYEKGQKSFRIQPDLVECCLLMLGARAGRKARRRSPECRWTKKNRRSWRALLRKLERARRRARRGWVQSFGTESYTEFHRIWISFLKWADAYLLLNPAKILYLAKSPGYRKFLIDVIQQHATQALTEKGRPVPKLAVFHKLIGKLLTRVRRGEIPGVSVKHLVVHPESTKQFLVDFVSAVGSRSKSKNAPKRYTKEK